MVHIEFLIEDGDNSFRSPFRFSASSVVNAIDVIVTALESLAELGWDRSVRAVIVS